MSQIGILIVFIEIITIQIIQVIIKYIIIPIIHLIKKTKIFLILIQKVQIIIFS